VTLTGAKIGQKQSAGQHQPARARAGPGAASDDAGNDQCSAQHQLQLLDTWVPRDRCYQPSSATAGSASDPATASQHHLHQRLRQHVDVSSSLLSGIGSGPVAAAVAPALATATMGNKISCSCAPLIKKAYRYEDTPWTVSRRRDGHLLR
jgi:hypothetical protein